MLIAGLSTGTSIGIALGISGGYIDNIGVCMQKLSHRQNDDMSVQYFKRPLWIFGLILYLYYLHINSVWSSFEASIF